LSLSAAGNLTTDYPDRGFRLRSLPANLCGRRERSGDRATLNHLPLQASLALDGKPMDSGQCRSGGNLSARSLGDRVADAGCLAAPGPAIAFELCDLLGHSGGVTRRLTRLDGLVILSALTAMVFEMPTDSPDPLLEVVQRAYQASVELAMFKGIERNHGIQAMTKALENATAEILEANTLDLEMSREMAMPELIVEWLKLTPERIGTAIGILKRLGELPDPALRVINAPYQIERSQTYCQLMPLGTIALIYEAFPELGAIAAGLCLKTGNSLILRGGSEAGHTNTVIYQALQLALEDAGLPTGCLEALHADRGSSIKDLVTKDRYLNLVIPYGRPSLVKQVTNLATAPVLRSAMGNCYLYWSDSGDLDVARWAIIDSHASEPDPVNAIEKVLVSCQQKSTSLVRLFNSLKEQGFELRGDGRLTQEYPDQLIPAEASEWGEAYLAKIVAFRMVEDIEQAIAWINRYSSGHADCLVTESYHESRQFAQRIDSSLVYINASPRFCRNPRSGDSVFLGMSNQKGHRRGLVGLETLTTLKQVVQGDRRF
jgi:glutamate-5-semialdehyde dehydrogenase